MSGRGRMVAVALVIAAGACLDNPLAPTTIHLSVQLQNAGSNDRAMLLEFAGSDASATIDTVVAAPGAAYQVLARARSATVWRVIVIGPIANGVVVELVVPKQATASLYSGTVRDVADAAFAELVPGARALTVTP